MRASGDFKHMRLAALCGILLCASFGCSPAATPSSSEQSGNAAVNQGGSLNAAGAAAVGGAGAPNQGGGPELGGGGAVSGSSTSSGASGAATTAGDASGGSATGGSATGGDAGSAAVGWRLSDCALAFPYQDEPERGTWLGGDSAYSTLLSPTLALWSFQDTFIGKHGQTTRPGASMIANSFALVSCSGGVEAIKYFWGNDGAIFNEGVQDRRFWPQQPILYKGFLFAAMTRVQGGATEIGTALARVSNPLEPPDQWHVEYFELATLSGLGKGTVVVDNYAYLFGNAGQAVVTRLPLDELIKPGAAPSALLEYLAADGQWKPGLDTAAAKKLGFSANVGTSFRYLKGPAKWLVLFTNTSGWPSATISISTAPSLEGPWTQPIDVYQVPEMTIGQPQYEKDNVCYAAIEHDEANPDSATELLFSYTCNSFVFAKQLANMAIYLPEIVKIKNPLAN